MSCNSLSNYFKYELILKAEERTVIPIVCFINLILYSFHALISHKNSQYI